MSLLHSVIGTIVAGTSLVGAAAMAQQTGDTSIRPFKFHASDEALADLRRRIGATKWPSRELVTDSSQGVQLATMREFARYWQTQYDWRKFEARLNAPRSWTERAYPKLIHYNRLPKGGHFAAWEQPQLLAAELRAAFKSLR